MRRLPPQSLASIPISTRRAAAAAALSLRCSPPAWQPRSNRNHSPHSSAASLSSSSSASTDPPPSEALDGIASSTAQPPRLPPFRFETGIALFAKRPPRPFPPPFLSAPSGSFSDPLSTHRGGRRTGIVRGATNGDDAVYAGDAFVCANDGVGAWSTRPKGNAGCVFPYLHLSSLRFLVLVSLLLLVWFCCFDLHVIFAFFSPFPIWDVS